MFRRFIFISLWTLVQGVVLAVVTTTISTGSITALTTSFPTQTIAQSACAFTSTLDTHSNPISICECSSTIIAGINLAVSGSSTTSYCALGGPAPTGFTRISALSGQPLPTLFSNSTTCSSSPAAQSGVTRVGTNASFTTTTTKSLLTTITGTSPTTSTTASATRSGAFKIGVAMCFGLMATTFVAVFLL